MKWFLLASLAWVQGDGMLPMLQWTADCFARQTGVATQWVIEYEGRDRDTSWIGNTTTQPPRHATVAFTLPYFRRRPQDVQMTALHEVLHVASADLFLLAYQQDPQGALIAAERFVNTMLAGPWWRGLCLHGRVE